MHCPPCSLDQLDDLLGHELVYVVVKAVVYAVDVAQPSVPTCPLPITYKTLSKGSYPDALGEKTVAEVKVFHLYPMLTCCYAVNNVLVFAWEGEPIG